MDRRNCFNSGIDCGRTRNIVVRLSSRFAVTVHSDWKTAGLWLALSVGCLAAWQGSVDKRCGGGVDFYSGVDFTQCKTSTLSLVRSSFSGIDRVGDERIAT